MGMERKMAYPDEVKSLLKDVILEGAVLVDKRKLLWLLGWGQDRTGAWDTLLGFWEAIGERRDSLMGLDVNGCILLATETKGRFEQVTEWT
jgi:hypothetical protein